MKNVKYRQCYLRNDKKMQGQVCWIPDEFSKKDKIIKIRENGVWDDGWKVILRGEIAVDGDYILEHSQDYKHQREASDI